MSRSGRIPSVERAGGTVAKRLADVKRVLGSLGTKFQAEQQVAYRQDFA